MQLYCLQILELQTSTDWATAAAYYRIVRLQLPYRRSISSQTAINSNTRCAVQRRSHPAHICALFSQTSGPITCPKYLGPEISSSAKHPSTFSKYLVLSNIDHSLSFDRPKRALFRTKYNGMTDINRKWTNLVRKMLCVWPRHASKHHISDHNTFLCLEKEQEVL